MDIARIAGSSSGTAGQLDLSCCTARQQGAAGRAVILSLMPKGVEHTLAEFIKRSRDSVILSLMPKGVEHSTAQHSTSNLIYEAEVLQTALWTSKKRHVLQG